ncbi:MAG: hypothetical protein NT080_14045 [Spirochaetes bacterium]|nr:hypothetical protein [Spirochaetota bacterium]
MRSFAISRTVGHPPISGGGRPADGRFHAFFAAALFAANLVVSCGLEEYPYLSPPTVDTEANLSGNTFSFRNDASNPDPPDCQGYEFYYRIYNATGPADSDKTTITVYIEDFTPDAILQKMRDLGYRRLSLGVTLEPLSKQSSLLEVPDPSDDSYPIDITFPSTGEEPYIHCTANDPEDLEISRLPEETSDPVSFLFPFVELDDADVDNTDPPVVPFFVQMYAVSSGIRLSDFTSIYSTPASLGKIYLP